MKKVNFLFVLLFLLLTGCAYSPNQLGDYYQHPSKLPTTGKANLYIYNPHSMQGDKPVVWIDNKKIVELPSNTFTQIQASPGTHSFGFAIDYLWGTRINNTNNFKFNANETYYIEYSYLPRLRIVRYLDDRKFVMLGNARKASGIFMCRFIRPLIDEI